MPPEPLRIPLAHWAKARLVELARLTASNAIAALDGATLLGERAALNVFKVPARISAGGGCRMMDALDGHIALSLSRPDDRSMLPALFGSNGFDVADDVAISRQIAARHVAELLERGRMLGLAIAGVDERAQGPCSTVTAIGGRRTHTAKPLVIDLSALWAGPLVSHLLWLGGARVIKVESGNRPDTMREGDPGLFGLLNQGKANVSIDLRQDRDRAALLALIRRADAVIEAARPRALRQLGIDADALVREIPGLVWITITGHGIDDDAASWIGFGDDVAVAGGLSAALRTATGTPGFVGDAIGDPLTGIHAALAAATALASGEGQRIVVSMRDVVAAAVAAEWTERGRAFETDLRAWAAAVGQPFPRVAPRQSGAVAPIGANNALLSNWR